MDAVERMVPVASCAGRPEAELKRAALESDGVRAVVATDDAGGQHPELVALTCGAARVLVPDHEADRARVLLAELDAGMHALDEGDHDHLAPPVGTGGWWVVVLALAFVAFRVLVAVL